MNDDELAFMTISDIGARLKSRNISSVRLTEMLLQRIEKHNGRLNAFITVSDEIALSQARQADLEIEKGSYRGPLHGVPIAYKDLIATRDIRTTAGSKYYENWIPDQDATVVTRLKSAGVVCLGKTGLNELAYGTTSDNPHFGAIRNPWKPDYHPGGSSGGSAVAVAAGLAFAALGTDTGCSVRQPAQCCGVVGHKPTFGMVSTAGVIPLVPTMDHVGPLARTVGDAAIVLQAISGPDTADPYSVRQEYKEDFASINPEIAGLKLAVPRNYFFEGGEAEVIQRVDKAVDVLRRLGADVADADIPDIVEAFGATISTFAETAAAHGRAVREKPECFSDALREMIARDGSRPVADYVAAQHFRQKFRRDVDAFMVEFDALLLPTSTVAAAPIAKQPSGHARERWKNCSIFNFTGQPAISVPCGFTAENLPVGLMLVGRAFQDAIVFRLARAYEKATGWHEEYPVL